MKFTVQNLHFHNATFIFHKFHLRLSIFKAFSLALQKTQKKVASEKIILNSQLIKKTYFHSLKL